jgi:GH15 family glucan-1,4-alpha-glucosidase
MPLRIEDYALIGDTQTGAVGRDGSMDWLCLPRFDSGACFAALLGSEDNGCWSIEPAGRVHSVRRRYREDTLVLETEFEAEGGRVALVDFMPIRNEDARIDLVRLVCGRAGQVRMRSVARFRFDYGRLIPWVSRAEDGLRALAGPDGLILRTPMETRGRDFRTEAEFSVPAGQTVPFTLTWFPSHRAIPPPLDPRRELDATEAWWRAWVGLCTYDGRQRDTVVRSLITLKALIYAPTGGIVAASTTSLPEALGGVRNWDYRYCWIRDATFMLYALASSGYTGEAIAWRDWLLRAVAGEPSSLQILYGIAGERRLTEYELSWLAGYENSRPVRVGNDAHAQLQLDVYGEMMDALHAARLRGTSPSREAWKLQRALLRFLAENWSQPDQGIWEVRGPRRPFTHSKMMAWVAFDRAVKAVEQFGADGPVDRWRALRDGIHADVCAKGYNVHRDAFTQYYGSAELDASLLMMPQVGFLPADDPRVIATIEAIRRELMPDGLVRRYRTDPEVDGLPPGEAAFLPCTFWLADCLAMMGRGEEAEQLFDRLVALCNDVDLLAEEYDPEGKRQLGNFPQAFSHVALVNAAHNLHRTEGGPASTRSRS